MRPLQTTIVESPRKILIAALFFLLTLAGAHGADITAPAEHFRAQQASGNFGGSFIPSDPVKCDLVLEGLIDPGDTKRLWQVHEAAGFRRHHVFLCLRSGGGDVTEAMDMARSLRGESFIITVVEDGKTCASACALVFMAGQALGRRVRTPQRYLHPRGRLMFHASYIPLEGAGDDAIKAWANRPADQLRRSLVETYSRGLQDLQTVIGTFSDPGQVGETVGSAWVRPSQLVKVYAQAPTEWTCVDNLDQIGLWNIDSFGMSIAPKPSNRMLRQACDNVYAWRTDVSAVPRRPDMTQLQEKDIKVSSPPPNKAIGGRNAESHFFSQRTLVEFGTRTFSQCVVEFHADSDDLAKLSHLSVFFLDKQDLRASDVYRLDPSALLPPETLFRTTAVTPGSASARNPASVAFDAIANRRMAGCTLRQLRSITQPACEAACGAEAKCQAYSYDRWSRVCRLKHAANDVRLDPASVTGVVIKNGVRPTVRTSIHKTVLEDFSMDHGPVRLNGREIAVQTVASTTACAAACKLDNGCLGYTYANEGNSCRTFSAIDSLSDAQYHYSAMWVQKEWTLRNR